MSVDNTESVLPPVRVVKIINAPRDAVFAAWIDPIVLAKWFGPPEVSVSEAEIDARIDGAYRIVMRGDSGAVHENFGVYRELVVQERLVFTWCITRRGSEEAARESLVTVEFRAHGESMTEITLTHELLKSEDARRGVRHGWSTSFMTLEEILQKGNQT